MPRVLSLGVELALAAATGGAFIGLLSGGPRAARLSRLVVLAGSTLALLAAVLTLGADESWFFDGIRISGASQAFKAVICAVLLLSVVRPRRGDAFARARTVDPFFRLIAAAALALAASAGDLLVLWLALDIASIAVIAAIATAGGWSARESVVRVLVVTWLPASLVTMLGAIMLAAAAGGTHFENVEAFAASGANRPVLWTGFALVTLATMARAARFLRAGWLAFHSTS